MAEPIVRGETFIENTITTEEMTDVQAREIRFTMLFVEGIKKLQEALGVTRLIPKQAGTLLKHYVATGELEDGEVAEGETIPLSQFAVEAVPFKEITFKKWAKSTTAEAIMSVGYNTAVTMTTDKMLHEAQKQVRTGLFASLADGKGTATGTGLQAALANAWGQLETLYEDIDGAVAPIYFVNPLDIADYLGTASITTQNTFGMRYIEDFLGLGSVITNTSVPQGKFYATAKGNLVGYYIPVNGADLGNAFNFTSDATGLIGIHEEADYTNMTARDTVVEGIEFFAEYENGVVVGTIAK